MSLPASPLTLMTARTSPSGSEPLTSLRRIGSAGRRRCRPTVPHALRAKHSAPPVQAIASQDVVADPSGQEGLVQTGLSAGRRRGARKPGPRPTARSACRSPVYRSSGAANVSLGLTDIALAPSLLRLGGWRSGQHPDNPRTTHPRTSADPAGRQKRRILHHLQGSTASPRPDGKCVKKLHPPLLS